MKFRILLIAFFCLISTGGFSQVYVTGDSLIGCGANCTTLTAHLEGDVPIDCSIGMDDIYSTPFSLGFTFNFYGTNYTQVLVGANGNLCFDMSLAGAYDPWPISAALLGNTSVLNCLCGPWCDIDYADYGGSCWYSLDGVAPNRKFVVTFCHCNMFTSSSCPGQYTTTQMILYETTNIAEVHIAHKTICTAWNSGRAICGVQNATGTAATVAPLRDWTPNWNATDEAWRFTPTGGGTAYTVTSIPYAPVPLASSAIYWFDSATHTLLDTGFVKVFCPISTTTYLAGAIGCNGGGTTGTAPDTSYAHYTVVVAPCPIFVTTNMPCPGDSIILKCIGDSTGATYAWSGPAGFSATSQYTYRFPSTYADTGTYRVIRTIGSVHDTSYVHVILAPKPVILATNNGPFCATSVNTLNLVGTPDSSGYTFSWVGPGGVFTSTLQSPTITPVPYSDTGIYTLIVKNSYGCKDTATTDVSMLTPPTLTTDSPFVKTCVLIPVNLHVYATPFTGSYLYSWTPGTALSGTTIPNPVVNPTVPGDVTYTVSVGLTAMPTCRTTDTIHVHTVPNDFTILNPDTIICRGQTVQVRVTGGSNEFNWLWTPTTGVSNTTITNPLITPVPGTTTYTLTASYAHCPNMAHHFAITVDTPAIPKTIMDTICLGQTQAVNLTFPGSGFYSFSWTPTTYVSAPTSAISNITPTLAGNYTYTVTVSPGTAPAGCSVNDMVLLHVAPNDFTLGNVDTVICRGQFVQTRITGSSEFTYLWSPATGVSNVNTMTPLITPTVTTTYVVTGTNGTHCSATHSFTIVVDTPAIAKTIHDTLCQNQSVIVDLTFPGSSFYNYTWTPGTYLSSTTGPVVSITPTAAGDPSYTVTVSPGTNPAGCAVNDIVIVHVVPNDFTLTNHDTVICIGSSVSALALGSSEFTWLWTPASGVSSTTVNNPTITPTVTTNYTVTATYGTHCTMSHHFNIEVDTPAIPRTITDTICLGMTDNVNLTFPGSSFYHFSWSPTTYLSSSTLPVVSITPTVVGDISYTITVYPGTNPAGCSISDVVNLHVAPNDFTLGNNDTVICLGKSVQAIVTGSTEFQYTWSPTAGVSVYNIPNPVLSPTVSTTYTVTASYSPHCPDMHHHFYIEVDTLAHPITITDTTCLAVPDTVNLRFPNSNTYTFNWVPTAPALNIWVYDSTSSNPYLIPTATGTFTWNIIVSPRAKDCSVSDVVNLLVTPNSFTITPTVATVCLGQQIAVMGVPYPLFSYQWVPSAGIPISDIINPVITADTSALYVVSAYFPKCPVMRDTLRVTVEPNPTVFMGGDRSMCEYDTMHLMATVIPGWYGSYSYSWTPATSLNVSDRQNVVYIDTVTQKVVVTVTTPNGCKGADSALITVYPGNFLTAPILPQNFCPGDSAKISISGATSYYWRPVLYLSDSFASDPTIKPITSGLYSVVGTSVYGCKDTLTFSINVHPAATIYLPDSATIYPGENYPLLPQSNCVNFNWYPTFGLTNSMIMNPVAQPDMSIKYFVNASTEWGCSITDSITLIMDPTTLLALPNAFTPGNGLNNDFKVLKRGLATLNYFRIYNRWGEMIFETTNIDAGWNGNYKGAPQPVGVYIWMLEAVSNDGTIFTKQGNVTLLR